MRRAGSIFWMIESGSVDIGPAPAEAGIRHLEVSARRGLSARVRGCRRAACQHAPGLVFGQDAGDVIVDDDHLIRHGRAIA